MNREQHRAAEMDCERVLVRFYRALDAGDHAELTAQLTPDGIWHRQGERLAGPAAVVAALARRSADVVSAHLVSNVVVDMIDDQSATVTAYITVLRHEGKAAAGEARPMPAPRALQLCRDRFVLTEAGWKIAEKSAKAIFKGEH